MNLFSLNDLTPTEAVLISGQILTFLGIIVNVIGNYSNGVRVDHTSKAVELTKEHVQKVRLEINGRLNQLMELAGAKREAEGFIKGALNARELARREEVGFKKDGEAERNNSSL